MSAESGELREWASAMSEWLAAHPDHDLTAEDVVGNALARALVLAEDTETVTEYAIHRGTDAGIVRYGMSLMQAQAWLQTDLELGYGPHVHIVQRSRTLGPWSDWTRVTPPVRRNEP